VPTAPRIPAHVHAAAAARGGGVLLDTRSGQWYAMNPTAHLLWQEWHRTGDFDAAVRTVAARHPGVRGDRIGADAERLAAELTARGLMTLEEAAGGLPGPPGGVPATAPDGLPGGVPAAVPRGVQGVGPDGGPGPVTGRVTNGEPGPVTGGEPDGMPGAVPDGGPGAVGRARGGSFAAVAGFVVALCLLRLPFGATVRCLSAVKRRWCRRAATPGQAQAVLAGVRRAARWYPGRAACLELSLAAVVALALVRCAADWSLGSAEDPFRFHAWVEVAGRPVVEPGDTETAAFRGVFRA
jgi:Transglutaminase-like superfamily/Coenzyme PQQ synthesis protein D (PqqD)